MARDTIFEAHTSERPAEPNGFGQETLVVRTPLAPVEARYGMPSLHKHPNLTVQNLTRAMRGKHY